MNSILRTPSTSKSWRQRLAFWWVEDPFVPRISRGISKGIGIVPSHLNSMSTRLSLPPLVTTPHRNQGSRCDTHDPRAIDFSIKTRFLASERDHTTTILFPRSEAISMVPKV